MADQLNPNLTLQMTAGQAVKQFEALTASAAALRAELVALNKPLAGGGNTAQFASLTSEIKRLNAELNTTRVELQTLTEKYESQSRNAVTSVRKQAAAVEEAEGRKQRAIKKTAAAQAKADEEAALGAKVRFTSISIGNGLTVPVDVLRQGSSKQQIQEVRDVQMWLARGQAARIADAQAQKEIRAKMLADQRAAAQAEKEIRAQQVVAEREAAAQQRAIEKQREADLRAHEAAVRNELAAITAAREKAAAVGVSTAERQAIAQQARNKAQDAGTLRSAARGIAGAGGGMFLTYGASVPIIAGTFAAGALARGTYTSGADFSYQSQFGAILAGQTDDQVKQLKSDLLDISKGTIYSPNDVAQGYAALAANAIKGADAFRVLGVSMNLALQGQLDLKTSSDALTGTLKEFDIPLSKIQQVGDEISKTANITLGGVPDVVAALKNTTGLSKYGISLEDVLPAITILGQQGITGGRSGTLIRNLFQELYFPQGQKAKSAMAALHVNTVNEATGQNVPAIDVIKQMQGALAKLRPADAQNALSQIFNTRALRAALNILLQATDQYKSLQDQIKDSSGSLAEFNSRLSPQPLYQYKVALADIKRAEDQAFDEAGTANLLKTVNQILESPGFTAGLKSFVSELTSLVQFVADHGDGFYSLLKGYLALKAAMVGGRLLTPLVSALYEVGAVGLSVFTGRTGLATALKSAIAPAAAESTSLFEGIGRVLLTLDNPIGLVVTGLTAAAALWLAFGRNSQTAASSVAAATNKILGGIDQQIKSLQDLNKAQKLSGNLSIGQLFVGIQEGRNKAFSEYWDKRNKVQSQITELNSQGVQQSLPVLSLVKGRNLRKQLADLDSGYADIQKQFDAREQKAQSLQQQYEKGNSAGNKPGAPAGTGHFNIPNDKLNTSLAYQQSQFYSQASQYYEKYYSNRLKQLGMEHQYGLVSDTTYQAQVDAIGQQRLDVQTKLLTGERDELQKRLAAATKPEQRVRIQEQLSKASQQLADAQLQQKNLTLEIAIRQKGQIKQMDTQTQKTIAEHTARNSVNIQRQRQTTLNQLLSSGGQAEQAARLQVISQYANDIAKAEQTVKNIESSPGVGANDARLVAAKTNLSLLKQSETAQENLNAEAARGNDDWQRSWLFGAQSALAQFNDNATNSAQNFRDVFTAATDGMTADLDNFVKTGKFSMNTFATDVINAMLKISEQRTAASILNVIMDFLPWPGQASTAMAPGAQSSGISVKGHSGGIVGSLRGAYSVNAGLFSDARRFHGGGIVGDEVPIIAKKKEGVFTPEQMQALAPVGSGGDSISVVTNVNMQTGSATTTTDGDKRNAKALGNLISGKVRSIILQEKRPGGLLASS